MYNIPELSGQSTPLVFGRSTIAGIYSGFIQYWNDPAIKSDNPNYASILPQQLIHITVRTDGSGTSQIFTQGLVSFDPSPRYETIGGVSMDVSFAATGGTSANPTWCDPITDEIQIMSISNCSSASPGSIHFGLLSPIDFVLRNVSFTCNAADDVIFSAINSSVGNCPLVLRKNNTDSQSYNITIGYLCAKGVNWIQPILYPSTHTVITVTTLQEGGYKNVHYSGTVPAVFNEMQSVFVSRLTNVTFTLASNVTSPQITRVITSSIGLSTSYAIMSAINAITPNLILSVTNSTNGNYTQHIITFNSAVAFSPPLLTLNTADPSLAFISVLQTGGNYPQFKSTAGDEGVDTIGSAKYTCYKRELLYMPWSYYAGNLNPGVLGSVIAFLAPFIVFILLGD